MKALGLRANTPRRCRKTTDSRHTKRIAPNLLKRDFTVPAPNQVLAGDITYITTTDGCCISPYCSTCTRDASWAGRSKRIDTELALGALRMAGAKRALEVNWIHHTDRDCRYGSDDCLAALNALGARPSMSRKGDCWDNAVSESSFATLEKELPRATKIGVREPKRTKRASSDPNHW